VIKIDWTLWLQFANFFALMAVLNFFLYRPLRDVLNRRRETIDGSYRKAKELEEQVSEKMARYEEHLQEAKLKGAQERAILRKDAFKEGEDIMAEAHSNATEYLKTIQGQIAADSDEACRSLKGETEILAGKIASKVLGRELQ
jgi:F-type H+-transporting ATPase subunit b